MLHKNLNIAVRKYEGHHLRPSGANNVSYHRESGKKGMVHYSGEMKEQVRKEIVAGKSQREVSRKYGISRYTIQSWCGLRPETKLRQIAPLPKGRPRKTQTLEDYQKENKRLKMENQLLRDFLSLTERM